MITGFRVQPAGCQVFRQPCVKRLTLRITFLNVFSMTYEHIPEGCLRRASCVNNGVGGRMKRANLFIFAGLGMVAALVIYGAASTKKAGIDNGHKNRLARIEALMNEGGVKYRPSFFGRHTPSRAKLAGLEPVKSVTEIAPPKAPVIDTKAEEAKKAADKKAADDKKKKDDEAKKKKKKKKKDEKSPDAPATDVPAANNEDDKKPESAADAGPSGGASGLPFSAANSQDPNKIPETADEWIAYLFANPSFEKTSKFLQLAQVGTVKLEVFYPVVEKMLASQVGRMREYGVLCAGNLPNAQSFQLLAGLANNVALDDKTKVTAQQYMEQYTRIEYVRFLGTVASLQNNAAASNDAISLIQRSLSRNLVNLAPVGTPSPATLRTPASAIPTTYRLLAATLSSVATTSTDGSVRTNAAQTATQIAALLSTLEAQAAAAATTPAVTSPAT
jgi:hypothetical protein